MHRNGRLSRTSTVNEGIDRLGLSINCPLSKLVEKKLSGSWKTSQVLISLSAFNILKLTESYALFQSKYQINMRGCTDPGGQVPRWFALL